jgi:hypothetical protein
MTPRKRLKLAYNVAERLKLLPFLDKEIDAVFFSLDLVREEDLDTKK